MKNRKSLSCSIVLLLVNTTGAVGALLGTLKVNFGTVLQPLLFCGGMLLLCVFAAYFWNGAGRRKMAFRGCLLGLLCLVCMLLFSGSLAEGLGVALQELLEKLNERYGIRFVWNLSREAGQSAKELSLQATRSVLAAMLPYVLLIGYGVFRKRTPALLAADAVWFCAACVMNDFPAYVWLVLCILGMAAVMIQNAFRDDERAGMQAVLIGTAAMGVVMALVYRFAVPFLDSRYEAIQEARVELSIRINEEWIPEIRRLLSWIDSGFGPGTTVSGKLTRKTGIVYTSDEIYRVTLTSLPESAVYLRGFVGKDYDGNEWAADQDASMEQYYRRKGWNLPEKGNLVNRAYHAFQGEAPEQVSVEELAAPGKLTVYPYGAEITEEYRVHWDGTVERKAGKYVLSYGPPEKYRLRESSAETVGEEGVGEETAGEEAEYREYVYDTYCDYPAERFPELTEFLGKSGFRNDSVYHSLKDVLGFLTGNAVYDLGVSNPPEGEDFVEYFLFERKRGYCAHFASSAVLMLRYLGVPARYVTGYAAAPEDFRSNADGTCSAVILNRQAHAWAEIYLDGVGWMPVEMTPGAASFPYDNTGEQLALAGRLTGADVPAEGRGEDASAAWQPVDGEGVSADGKQPGEEEEQEPETGKDGQKKPQLSDGAVQETDEGAEPPARDDKPSEEEGRKDGDGEEPRETNQSGGEAVREPGKNGTEAAREQGRSGEEDTREPEKPGGAAGRPGLSPGAQTVLICLLGGTVPLLLLLLLWNLARQSACRQLEKSGGREKVFLLYRHTRRLLQAAGSGERLVDSEEAAAEFMGILEKCGFSEMEPGDEELRQAGEYCERVVKEACKGLPFYKKPFFLLLDLYGLHR